MRADEYFPFLLFFNSATFAFQASFKAFSFLENPFLESSFETFMISMESQQVGCKTGKQKCRAHMSRKSDIYRRIKLESGKVLAFNFQE